MTEQIILFAILGMARGAGAWDAVYANRIIACLGMGIVVQGVTLHGLGLAALLWLGFLFGWSHAFMFGRKDDWRGKFKPVAWFADMGNSFYGPVKRRLYGAAGMSARWLMFAPAVTVYGDWRFIPALLLAGVAYLGAGLFLKSLQKLETKFFVSQNEEEKQNLEVTCVRIAEAITCAMLGALL